MAGTISYNPANSKKLREQVCALSEYKKAAQAEIQMATQEGNLDKARGVLQAATLRIKEYENFRESLSQEELLLAKYGVEVINEHTILFVIPKGTSRISILEEANKLVQERDGRDLIGADALSEWQNNSSFTQEQKTSKLLCIDGNVLGGEEKTRAEQEAFLGEEFRMPEIEDLAVAFSLHWVATAEPLFEWYIEDSFVIRGDGGALFCNRNGLWTCAYGDDDDYGSVGVSALVSPE